MLAVSRNSLTEVAECFWKFFTSTLLLKKFAKVDTIQGVVAQDLVQIRYS
jgi:hypothetical protein